MKLEKFDAERLAMTAEQIERRGLRQPRLLEAFRRVPRHQFVPPDMTGLAYYDGPLQIGCGQTISQPYIVALMTSLAQLEGQETVLEVGTGSGYQAAILGCLAGQVHTIERHHPLAERARQALAELGFTNVYVHEGDGTLGWIDAAPFQAVLVTAGAPHPPQPLLDQLAEGGRLVIPVGGRGFQELEVWQRQGKNFTREEVIPVAFVPLRGAHGWSAGEWPE